MYSDYSPARCENGDSPVFTLGDGVVLYLFLFLIVLCRETGDGPRDVDKEKNNKAEWDQQPSAAVSEKMENIWCNKKKKELDENIQQPSFSSLSWETSQFNHQPQYNWLVAHMFCFFQLLWIIDESVK